MLVSAVLRLIWHARGTWRIHRAGPPTGAVRWRRGGNIVTRGRWDPAGFAAHTPEFVTGSDGDYVSFGYSGQRTADASTGIATADVAWLLQYLGRVSDRQLHQMSEASGASDEEAGAFAAAIRSRIAQLAAAAAGG